MQVLKRNEVFIILSRRKIPELQIPRQQNKSDFCSIFQKSYVISSWPCSWMPFFMILFLQFNTKWHILKKWSGACIKHLHVCLRKCDLHSFLNDPSGSATVAKVVRTCLVTVEICNSKYWLTSLWLQSYWDYENTSFFLLN